MPGRRRMPRTCMDSFQLPFNAVWIFPRRRGPQFGWRHCPLTPMVLPSISWLSGMLSLSAMFGHSRTLPLTVAAAIHFVLSTPCLVQLGGSHQSDTMRWGTSLLQCCRRCAMVSQGNLTCNLCRERPCPTVQPSLILVLDWTSLYMASGEADSRRHFLMWGCLTHALDRIDRSPYHPCTEDTNRRRRGSTSNEYGKRRMPPSRHWFSRQQEGWVGPLPPSTGDWLPYWARSGAPPTARPWTGFAAVWTLLYWEPPSCPSEEPDPLTFIQL